MRWCIFFIFLCGCETVPSKEHNCSYEKLKECYYLGLTIRDKPEPGHSDYWKMPHETISEGGDCEDKAFFMQKVLIGNNFRSKVVIGMIRIKSDSLHAWNEVELNGKTYILDCEVGYFDLRENIRNYYFYYGDSYSERILWLRAEEYRLRLVKSGELDITKGMKIFNTIK